MFSITKNLFRQTTPNSSFTAQNKPEMVTEDKTGSFVQEKSQNLFDNQEKNTNLIPAKISQSSFVKKGAAVLAAGLGAKLLVDAYSKTTITPQDPSSKLGYAAGGTFFLLATTFAAYKYGKSQKSKQNQQSSKDSENPDTSSKPKHQYRIVRKELQPNGASKPNATTPSSIPSTSSIVIKEKYQEESEKPSSNPEKLIDQEESQKQQSTTASENPDTSSQHEEPSQANLESNTNTNNVSSSPNEIIPIIEKRPQEESENPSSTTIPSVRRPLPTPKTQLNPEKSIIQEDSTNQQSTTNSDNPDTSSQTKEQYRIFKKESNKSSQADVSSNSNKDLSPLPEIVEEMPLKQLQDLLLITETITFSEEKIPVEQQEVENQPIITIPPTRRPLPFPKITEVFNQKPPTNQDESESQKSSTDTEKSETSSQPKEFEVDQEPDDSEQSEKINKKEENKTQEDENNHHSSTDPETTNNNDNSLDPNNPDNSIPPPSDLPPPLPPEIELLAKQMKSLTSINYLCQEILQVQKNFLQELDIMVKIKKHFTDEKIGKVIKTASLDKQEDLKQLLTALLRGGNIEACREFVVQLISMLTTFELKEDKDTLLSFADTYLKLTITEDFFNAVLNHITIFESIQNDEKEIQTAWNIEIKKCLPLDYFKYINLTDPFIYIYQQFSRYQLLATDLHKAILQAKDIIQIDEQLLNTLTDNKENLVNQISALNKKKKENDTVFLTKAETAFKLVEYAKQKSKKFIFEDRVYTAKQSAREHDLKAIEAIQIDLKNGLQKAITLKEKSKIDEFQKALNWLNETKAKAIKEKEEELAKIEKANKKKEEKANKKNEKKIAKEEKANKKNEKKIAKDENDKLQKKDSKLKFITV